MKKCIFIFIYFNFILFDLLAQTKNNSWKDETYRKEMYSNKDYLSAYIEEHKSANENLTQLQNRLIIYCKKNISENIKAKIESKTNYEKKEYNKNFESNFNQEIKVSSQIELVKFETEYYYDENLQKAFCFVYINKNSFNDFYEKSIISSFEYCGSQLTIIKKYESTKYIQNIQIYYEVDSILNNCLSQIQLLDIIIDNYNSNNLLQKIYLIKNKIKSDLNSMFENTKIINEDCSISPTFEKNNINSVKFKVYYLNSPINGLPFILNDKAENIFYSNKEGKFNIALDIEDLNKVINIKLGIKNNFNISLPYSTCTVGLLNTNIFIRIGKNEFENQIYLSLAKSLSSKGFIIEQRLSENIKYILEFEITSETSEEEINGIYASFGTANIKVLTNKNNLVNNIQVSTKGVGLNKQQSLINLKSAIIKLISDKIDNLLF